MNRPRMSRYYFLVVFFIGTIDISSAGVGSVSPESSTAPLAVSVPTLISPKAHPQDAKLGELIMAKVAEDYQRAEARKGWRYVDHSELAILGLRKNLIARLAGLQPLLAQEALLEASALFDPVLEVSVNLSVADQTARSITTNIIRQKYKSGPQCQVLMTVPTADINNRADIWKLCFAKKDGSVEFMGPVYAVPPSSEQPGKNKAAVTSVGITQQLPWGPVLTVVDTSTYNKTYYSTMGNPYSYDAAWTSSLFASLSIPLPGTKGFGPLAPADYSVKLAQINNQRGFWDVKAAINNILLEIDLAYWSLVSAAENLAVIIENTRLLGLLEPSFSRRYEQKLMTSFDKLQFDSEIAQAKLDEELALDNYYRASTALAGMLTDNPEEVFDYILLPVGFSYDYSGLTTPLVGEVQEVALKKRPEISAQKLDLEAKNLNLYFAENRLLPDVRFNISGTFSQNGSTYGYKDIARSLEGLASPDAIAVNTSIAHTSALGRRSDKANMRVAEVNVVAGNYSARGLKNSVKRQVSDAHAGYMSAKNRLADAGDALAISELAYQLLETKFKIGENVSQVELNRNRRALVSAKRAVSAAQIDIRIMESRLMAAQGNMTEHYFMKNAENQFEQRRIATLVANNVLKYFRNEIN